MDTAPTDHFKEGDAEHLRQLADWMIGYLGAVPATAVANDLFRMANAIDAQRSVTTGRVDLEVEPKWEDANPAIGGTIKAPEFELDANPLVAEAQRWIFMRTGKTPEVKTRTFTRDVEDKPCPCDECTAERRRQEIKNAPPFRADFTIYKDDDDIPF
jgi:hypothetical protein